MRKLFISLVIIIPLLVLGILILKNKNTNPPKSNAAPAVATSEGGQDNQFIEINNLTFSWYEVSDVDKLKLIPNFNEKLSSKEIIENNNCQFLSNASFYSKNSEPLGLFITNGNSLSDFENNSLFDGILSVNDLATPRITRDVPADHLQIAIQTGPILKENNNFISLTITNDTDSRRVLAAVTGDNKLFFMTIYNSKSEFTGPLLADVPSLLKQFENKTGITFADAINLDGGSASAFYTKTESLSEFNPVGAFFCQP